MRFSLGFRIWVKEFGFIVFLSYICTYIPIYIYMNIYYLTT